MRVMHCLLATSGILLHPIGAVAAPADFIRQMAGCYEVVFHYVEDGSHDKDYAPVLEKAEIASEDPLVLSRTMIADGQAIPHWQEEWTETTPGTWRQKVIGPHGDERYTCEAPWILNQWTCTTDHAAKPRRDADRPYDYLRRTNTLQVNDKRWVNVQTNHKLQADDSLYSVEIGWNTYEKVDAERCDL